jgi:hypothetical protein
MDPVNVQLCKLENWMGVLTNWMLTMANETTSYFKRIREESDCRTVSHSSI